MDWLAMLADWWGLLVLVAAGAVYIWAEKAEARELAEGLVREVEANARKYGLETLDQKRVWVYAWYPYLPAIMTTIITETAWRAVVDWAIDKAVEWGEE